MLNCLWRSRRHSCRCSLIIYVFQWSCIPTCIHNKIRSSTPIFSDHLSRLKLYSLHSFYCIHLYRGTSVCVPVQLKRFYSNQYNSLSIYRTTVTNSLRGLLLWNVLVVLRANIARTVQQTQGK